MNKTKSITQFSSVVSRFPGGIAEVSRLLRVTEAAVYRWNYKKEKGGGGGSIPDKYHAPLLRAARRLGYELSPRDFYAHLEAK